MAMAKVHASALVLFKEALIKGGYGNFHIYVLFYGGQSVNEFFAGECHRFTGFTGACSSTDSVNIGLRIQGDVVINDHIQGVYIEPARRDVRCDKDA